MRTSCHLKRWRLTLELIHCFHSLFIPLHDVLQDTLIFALSDLQAVFYLSDKQDAEGFAQPRDQFVGDSLQECCWQCEKSIPDLQSKIT